METISNMTSSHQKRRSSWHVKPHVKLSSNMTIVEVSRVKTVREKNMPNIKTNQTGKKSRNTQRVKEPKEKGDCAPAVEFTGKVTANSMSAQQVAELPAAVSHEPTQSVAVKPEPEHAAATPHKATVLWSAVVSGAAKPPVSSTLQYVRSSAVNRENQAVRAAAANRQDRRSAVVSRKQSAFSRREATRAPAAAPAHNGQRATAATSKHNRSAALTRENEQRAPAIGKAKTDATTSRQDGRSADVSRHVQRAFAPTYKSKVTEVEPRRGEAEMVDASSQKAKQDVATVHKPEQKFKCEALAQADRIEELQRQVVQQKRITDDILLQGLNLHVALQQKEKEEQEATNSLREEEEETKRIELALSQVLSQKLQMEQEKAGLLQHIKEVKENKAQQKKVMQRREVLQKHQLNLPQVFPITFHEVNLNQILEEKVAAAKHMVMQQQQHQFKCEAMAQADRIKELQRQVLQQKRITDDILLQGLNLHVALQQKQKEEQEVQNSLREEEEETKRIELALSQVLSEKLQLEQEKAGLLQHIKQNKARQKKLTQRQDNQQDQQQNCLLCR